MDIEYSIITESFTGARLSRVYFREGSGESNNIQGDITMKPQSLDQFTCANHRAYIRVRNFR